MFVSMPDRPGLSTVVLGITTLAALTGGCDGFTERELPYAAAPSAQIVRGQKLLAQYQCGSCHMVPEVSGARGQVGPTLQAFGRRSYIAGHIPNRPDTLAHWIADPRALVSDTAMPSMGVSDADARDMAAYLLALE